jgi:hypothetical protein
MFLPVTLLPGKLHYSGPAGMLNMVQPVAIKVIYNPDVPSRHAAAREIAIFRACRYV